MHITFGVIYCLANQRLGGHPGKKADHDFLYPITTQCRKAQPSDNIMT